MTRKAEKLIVVDEKKLRRSLQIIALGNLLDLRCPKCGKERRWGVNNIAIATDMLLEQGTAEFDCPDPDCGETLMTYILGIKEGKLVISVIIPDGVVA